VGIEKFALEDVIKLAGVNENRVGPHGLCIQGDLLFTSNCYDGSVSIVDLKNLKSYSYYLGRNCRDICSLKYKGRSSTNKSIIYRKWGLYSCM